MPRCVLFLLSMCLVPLACGQELQSFDTETVASSAPLTGVDGSKDSADFACHVVLRSMHRMSNNMGGYVTKDGVWIYRATIDISDAAAAETLVPAILVQTREGWYGKEATAIESDVGGYQRFQVDVWQGMPSEGMSGTSLRNTRIPVIPYLQLAQGGRLFDHNRIADPLGSYTISGEAGLAIGEDANACKPTEPAPEHEGATLRFSTAGIETFGALIAGNKLTVEYDLNRLTSCRGTHNGYPAWDLIAHARFQPSGETANASVRAFVTNNGTPTNEAYSVPFTVTLPENTERVELWFENYTGAGSSCRAWDSNNSKSWGFAVRGPVGWIGKPELAISRGGAGPCDGVAMTDGFMYDTWVRQRAAYRNVCFQVWKKGVTDWANPNLWRDIDVQVHYRYSAELPWQTAYVPSFDRQGNNARYKLDLTGLDPFRPYYCTQEPYTRTEDGQYDDATMEFFIVANGVELRQGNGETFVGTFRDYPTDHASYCNQ